MRIDCSQEKHAVGFRGVLLNLFYEASSAVFLISSTVNVG